MARKVGHSIWVAFDRCSQPYNLVYKQLTKLISSVGAFSGEEINPALVGLNDWNRKG